MEGLKRQKNDLSKIVAQRKKESKGQDKCEEEIKQSKSIDEDIATQTKVTSEAVEQIERELYKIGNIVGPDVVVSKDEAHNKVVATWGEPNKEIVVNGEELGKLHHHEIMQCLDILEMERGQKIAGHRGYFLKGLGVLLNQALINYGLSILHKKSYTPLQPPYFMKKSIME